MTAETNCTALAGACAGIVLAGGHSERFGERDKALATVGGEPMLARVVSRVDETPGNGPLAGLQRGLEAIDPEYVAVVACDMPGVEPAFLRLLFERAAGHDATVPVLDGEPQPAQAVYRAPAIRRVAECQLSNDRRSLRGALGRLDAVQMPVEAVADVPARRSLVDLNTRAALAAFESETGLDAVREMEVLHVPES